MTPTGLDALGYLDDRDLAQAEQRLAQVWDKMRETGFPVLPLTGLLPGFGTWRRVIGPVTEPLLGTEFLIYRCAQTDRYALIGIPERNVPRQVNSSDRALLSGVVRDAVVSDFFGLWRATLDHREPLLHVAAALWQRSQTMPEPVRVLAGLGLSSDTMRAVAARQRSALKASVSATTMTNLVERFVWADGGVSKAALVMWATQVAHGYIRLLPEEKLATVREGLLSGQVVLVVEDALGEQHALDPSGARLMIVEDYLRRRRLRDSQVA